MWQALDILKSTAYISRIAVSVPDKASEKLKRLCNETKVLSHLERTPAILHTGSWDEKVEGREGENRKEKACF